LLSALKDDLANEDEEAGELIKLWVIAKTMVEAARLRVLRKVQTVHVHCLSLRTMRLIFMALGLIFMALGKALRHSPAPVTGGRHAGW
jgi:hypothetical protein